MNGIARFDFRGNGVRVVMIGNEPWFVGKDVAQLLGYAKPRNAIELHCKGALKQGVPTSGGIQEMALIPERDVYRLIMRSRLPEAERFEEWVVGEVLPSIRKTGGYGLPQTFSEALQLAADLARQNEQLEQERIEAQPKVAFYDAVTGSKDAIEMKDAAKALDMGLGRNKLFAFLRDREVLMKDNTPYQEYVDRGYFRVVEQKYTRADGETHINLKTVVYQRGLDFIRRTLEREGAVR